MMNWKKGPISTGSNHLLFSMPRFGRSINLHNFILVRTFLILLFISSFARGLPNFFTVSDILRISYIILLPLFSTILPSFNWFLNIRMIDCLPFVKTPPAPITDPCWNTRQGGKLTYRAGSGKAARAGISPRAGRRPKPLFFSQLPLPVKPRGIPRSLPL